MMLALLAILILLALAAQGILGTEDIGTGQTYTTIAAWENAVPADITGDKTYTGQCLGEAFAENPAISGHTTDASHYIELTAKSGNEHDGRANEMSALGNTRIEKAGAAFVLQLNDAYIRVSWMEVFGPGNNALETFYCRFTATGVHYYHHNIIHNDQASASTSQHGLRIGTTDTQAMLYRNIIYGAGGDGAALAGAANSAFLCNTLYENNAGDGTWQAGIDPSTAYDVENNAAMANGTKDIANTNGTQDYNATSDGTGDDEGANGIANLTTADQFTNPTTTWANTDLRIKAGADLIDAGTSFDTGTYPEINVPITSRGVTISGTWDIGADEYVAAGGAVIIPPWLLSRRAV